VVRRGQSGREHVEVACRAGIDDDYSGRANCVGRAADTAGNDPQQVALGPRRHWIVSGGSVADRHSVDQHRTVDDGATQIGKGRANNGDGVVMGSRPGANRTVNLSGDRAAHCGVDLDVQAFRTGGDQLIGGSEGLLRGVGIVKRSRLGREG
jgi:hypothetical protein